MLQLKRKPKHQRHDLAHPCRIKLTAKKMQLKTTLARGPTAGRVECNFRQRSSVRMGSCVCGIWEARALVRVRGRRGLRTFSSRNYLLKAGGPAINCGDATAQPKPSPHCDQGALPTADPENTVLWGAVFWHTRRPACVYP